MLRFLPDSLVEGLLRPLFMADPAAGLYFEDSAPDWRFAAFLLIMATVLVARRRSLGTVMTTSQGVTALGTVLLLLLWTFVSGNGRYFSWALLLIGPLVVMACMLLPGSRSLRWTVLSVVLALQLVVLGLSRSSNPWAAILATDTSMPLAESPLRQQPAVFLTVSNLSYSILVPRFHPQSRWASISGQYDILPGTLEWGRLGELLSSPLPKYLLTPVRPEDHDQQGQPYGRSLQVLSDTLARFGLAFQPGGCVTLSSSLSGPEWLKQGKDRDKYGFWVCSLRTTGAPPQQAPAAAPAAQANLAALDAVERSCPRFFPPGGGQPSLVEGAYQRHYRSTDVRLWVHPAGLVLFQYFRAMNPTVLGTVDDVRAGRFTLPCDKLPGRYRPFWERD